MRGLRQAPIVAGLAAAALLLASCGGDDTSTETSSGGTGQEGTGATGGSFSLEIGNPENPLLPGNTSETSGGAVMDALFTGLVQYNTETTEAEFTGVAESIESDDNTTWTVTLKEGWTFHDGSPVTATSFVDAWNYAAYSPNAQGNSYFFANVEGYDDLQAPTNAAGEPTGDPKAKELTGLKVIDDQTFEVTLSAPFAQYPITVGYTAFFPLPEAFYKDVKGFGVQPIGNGPFQAEEPFQDGQGITLTKYEEYGGEKPANADEVEYRVFRTPNTAYTEVQAGSLDIMTTLPIDAIASAPDEFGERYIERPRSDFTYIGFPLYDERYSDPEVRRAISMAIDREAITEGVFNGTREPAFSVISPVVDGSRDDACEYCVYDPEAAKQMLEDANFDFDEPIELWFNSDGDHEAWMQAVGNQLRQNLGVEYVLEGNLAFDQYLPLGDQKGYTGPFRLGWIMDYPSPQNFLEPLYSTAAQPPNGSNSTFYSNEEFDDLVAQGNSAESNAEAIELYQQAEDVLLEDMPIIPMFFGLEQAVTSENVANVIIDAYGRVAVADVEVVSGG